MQEIFNVLVVQRVMGMLGEGDDDYQTNYKPHFCNACGSSQKDELEFYEEMDCGPGPMLHKSLHAASVVLAVAAFLFNML